MELRGEQRTTLVGRHETATSVRAPGHALLGVIEIKLVAGRVGGSGTHRGEGMYEIETFTFHTLHEHGTFRRLDGVPSHVRHHIGVKQFHVALDQAKARSAGAVFHTAFEHDLLAHAHAEHRSPGTQTILDHGVSAHRLESFHACAESDRWLPRPADGRK